MNDPQTIPIKIIIVGSINVGKTSLVAKYATGKIPIQKEMIAMMKIIIKVKVEIKKKIAEIKKVYLKAKKIRKAQKKRKIIIHLI